MLSYVVNFVSQFVEPGDPLLLFCATILFIVACCLPIEIIWDIFSEIKLNKTFKKIRKSMR